jgi:hypothetical protein
MRLVADPPFRGWFSDATPAMARFREKEDDDLGDPRLRLMKRRSKWFYRAAVGLWLLDIVILIGLKLAEIATRG